jgi:hypothetical protein
VEENKSVLKETQIGRRKRQKRKVVYTEKKQKELNKKEQISQQSHS